MESKSAVEVLSFISSLNNENNKCIYDDLSVKIEQNFAYFEVLGREQEGSLQKLAFISAILREINLTHLIIEHQFESTSVLGTSETYRCSFVAEPYNLESMPYRNLIINRYNTLREKYILNPHRCEPFVRISTLLGQKEKILSLFEKINSKIKNYDATIGLLSYFLFESECLSQNKIENLLMFFDLYDLDNKSDRWFSAINLEAHYREIRFKVIN